MAARARARVSFQPAPHMAKLVRTIEQRMIRAERRVRARHVLVTSRPYPPASRPGQWPRRRTGKLMRGLRANVNRTLSSIRLTVQNVAVSKEGFRYPEHLEKRMGRLGLRRLLDTTWRAVGRILATGR